MEDPTSSDVDSGKLHPVEEAQLDVDRRLFGGLEFQVSEVVGRLEAVVNAQDSPEDEPENRKFSTNSFEPEETPMDEILKVLEDMVVKTDPSCDSSDPPLLPTDPITRAAILSHSIMALFGRLERSHAARLGAHIASESTLWLSHMFKLSDYNAFYHQEHFEGMVRVTRMLINHRYPRYVEDGALAFTNHLPSIYSCMASPMLVIQHLCRQLALPLSCVRPVPADPSGRGMDLAALEKFCEEDLSNNRIPLLVIGEVGAPPLGTTAPLVSLARICKKNNIYLYLRGHALALPAALGNSDQKFTIADALTLTPGLWFGVPGLPTVTFYRLPEAVTWHDHSTQASGTREGALLAISGLSNSANKLSALPVWTCVRAGGTRRLARRIEYAFRSARAARTLLHSAQLRLISDRPGGDELPNVDIVEAVSAASACVVFQFAPAGVQRPPPYYDKLNSWLGQVLQRETDMINIEVCETEDYGVVLRYCPLEDSTRVLDGEKLEAWACALEAQLHVLHATVNLREPFQKKLAQHDCLKLVHVPGWAGLGGVRYVPPGWEHAPPEELNSLNQKLVDTLRATDGAFSCGEGEDKMACVRFGMVTADTDVDELLELVISAGKDVEERSKVLTDMTEVLKKGIEAAQEELEREAWNEGLLRRVPVVGRVVSWWAPPPPPAGRRLLLTHGTLQSTRDLYSCAQNKDTDEEPARAHPAPSD
ncbi:pyridoxal-dependent decarboxylase domain-containing protein 1 [Leptidea sinapis]|uniref:Pyridoxal-dependent decarboxylase domain-containing protein 1 n=1 Tax=Leptidea sinapis TaxID=189913 RepID=A0A5E4PMP6_9NEOP|nr:pyridoxal-dependent decarboxylase domain-containing protein 1 [Leptidea sinapis]VVC86592.1 unnamed protein product [Leptidea sinapis]